MRTRMRMLLRKTTGNGHNKTNKNKIHTHAKAGAKPPAGEDTGMATRGAERDPGVDWRAQSIHYRYLLTSSFFILHRSLILTANLSLVWVTMMCFYCYSLYVRDVTHSGTNLVSFWARGSDVRPPNQCFLPRLFPSGRYDPGISYATLGPWRPSCRPVNNSNFFMCRGVSAEVGFDK